jgi:hypothetical protein
MWIAPAAKLFAFQSIATSLRQNFSLTGFFKVSLENNEKVQVLAILRRGNSWNLLERGKPQEFRYYFRQTSEL